MVSFGYSAPYKVLDEKFGFTAENVCQRGIVIPWGIQIGNEKYPRDYETPNNFGVFLSLFTDEETIFELLKYK